MPFGCAKARGDAVANADEQDFPFRPWPGEQVSFDSWPSRAIPHWQIEKKVEIAQRRQQDACAAGKYPTHSTATTCDLVARGN
jgi:hypothetical protein